MYQLGYGEQLQDADKVGSGGVGEKQKDEVRREKVCGEESAFFALLKEAIDCPMLFPKVNELFKQFKILADAKKTITDADLDALVANDVFHDEVEDTWKLKQ